MSGIVQALIAGKSAPSIVGRAAAGASVSATTFTINYPAGTQDGDVIVVFFATGLNGATVTCSAATQIMNTVYSGSTIALFTKVVSGESSITATFSSSSGTTGAALIVIRNGAYSTYGISAPPQSTIDPPAVTVAKDNIVATFGFGSLSATSITNATETNYDVTYALATTTRGVFYGVGSRVITAAGTEDPAAYAITGATLNDTAETAAFSVVFV